VILEVSFDFSVILEVSFDSSVILEVSFDSSVVLEVSFDSSVILEDKNHRWSLLVFGIGTMFECSICIYNVVV
jgi:hypothetical protein